MASADLHDFSVRTGAVRGLWWCHRTAAGCRTRRTMMEMSS